MRKRDRVAWIACALILTLLLGGCKKEGAPMEADYEAAPPVQRETSNAQRKKEIAQKEREDEKAKEEEAKAHEGMRRSKMTGVWVDKDRISLRPYAIMINNIKAVSPQSGISQASVLYEALVEGGITRLMGIFEDFDADRIGSVRSARHYYASIADEYDAIFVHFGETKYATSKIAELGVDNLSGLEAVGDTVFYRDSSIKAPHNAFTSLAGIEEGVKEKQYRTSLPKDFENHFTFAKKDVTPEEGEPAKRVELGFSGYTSPYFEYDEKAGTYGRFQFGGPHVDANTGEQLSFKNIIVQVVSEWDIDKNGYQTMDIERASGEGYYITNGRAVPITWEKSEATKKMHYYEMDGNVLEINNGKTFIAIYPKARLNWLKISG